MNTAHQELLDRIRSSASALQRTVEAVPDNLVSKRPREGEWSVLETIIHVRNTVVMAYGLRLRRLFYESEPLFADYDEGTHRLAALEQDQSVGDIVHMVVAEHAQIADLLRLLPDDEWQRVGRHAELGSMSIEFLAWRVAEHALDHEQQIADTIAALTSA